MAQGHRDETVDQEARDPVLELVDATEGDDDQEAHGPGRVEPVDAAERDDDPSPAGTGR